jgi:WD40 repeat protein
MLATADNQGQVVIWHLKDQQILTTFQAHTHSISTLLFATNNTIYTSSG